MYDSGWKDAIQWAAGAGLIVFGLDELARHTGGLIVPAISAFCERFRYLPGIPFVTGILAGLSLQGRRGSHYLRRRRLAGLLTLPQTVGLSAGMISGMMLPALAVFLIPPPVGNPVLIIGLLLWTIPRKAAWRSAGRALVGLGCCWIGRTACSGVLPPAFIAPSGSLVAAAILLPAAYLLRTPAPLWLILASTGFNPATLLLAGVAAITGWTAAVTGMLSSLHVPFQPSLSLLDYRDVIYPERALQASLQEIRRLTAGLAQAASHLFPEPADGGSEGRRTLDDVELAMNEFKPAAQRYLNVLARRKLNERQAQMLLHLHRCVSDLERVSDHMTNPAVMTTGASAPEWHAVPPALQSGLIDVLRQIVTLLETVAGSITGNHEYTGKAAQRILDAQENTLRTVAVTAEDLHQAMEHKTIPPATAILYREALSHFERMIRHIRAIAMIEKQPAFLIDPDAVHERSERNHPVLPDPVSLTPYLERIRDEEVDR